VTPLHRPAVVRQPTAGAVSEILTVHPKQYRDAQLIAENFRDGIPVIINLSQMSDADARRLIDFASGLSLGLYGRIERVTSKVFLLSPENVAISGDGTVAPADPRRRPSRSNRGDRAPGGIRRQRPSPALSPRAARATRPRVHPDVQPGVASAGFGLVFAEVVFTSPIRRCGSSVGSSRRCGSAGRPRPRVSAHDARRASSSVDHRRARARVTPSRTPQDARTMLFSTARRRAAT
jgi:hypothetical protein